MSVSDPFSEEDAELGEAFLNVLLRADAMGLLTSDVRHLDQEALGTVGKAFARHGIGKGLALEAVDPGTFSRKKLLDVVARWRDALEQSPVPETELPALLELFGLEMLADLLGTSPSSLRRYTSGARSAPDLVAARAHFLSVVVGDLRGAYNAIGVRRWFDRERSALGGRSPRRLLGKNWDPDSVAAMQVRELARSLVGSPAT